MAKNSRKLIFIFILALIVLYVIIYIIPRMTGVFETTEVLKAGTLQVTENTTCYFVRDESVYEAGSVGSLKYLIKEGIHVRSGSKIVKITENQQKETSSSDPEEETSRYSDMITRLSNNVVRSRDCKAQSSGVLSYFVDGYEAYFKPDTMDKLTYEKVKDLKNTAEDTTRKSTLIKEPIFKICDNDNWYMVCWVPAASIAKYEVGNTVTVELPEGDVKATVKSITEEGESWKVIFRSNRYYEAFAKSRAEEATIVSQDYNGLIAKNSSITTKDGKTGVMVRQTSGEYAFTQVKVIASDGEYSVLKDVSFIDAEGNSVDTINVYDEILKKPGKGA